MKVLTSFLTFLLPISIVANSCKKKEVSIGPTTLSQTSPPVTQPSGTTINTQLIPVGNLSQARSNMAVASVGNKLLFAGGTTSTGAYSSRVDIYDIATNIWTSAELSQARKEVATAVLGKIIYFASGELATIPGTFSARVDIYNTETNTWAITNLGGVDALVAGAATGNKVVFASGITAHIYDTSTKVWETAKLSVRPGEGNCCQSMVGGIAATVIDNFIYFAGGLGSDVHKSIDIYNTKTNSWSTSSLFEYKGGAAAIAIGNTNYWAGGYTYPYNLSNRVEIRDMASGLSTFGSLFQGNSFFSAVQKNDTIIFFTGNGAVKNKFDVYDIKAKTWAIGVLPEDIEDAEIISVNNTAYVAGGNVNGELSNKLRRLEFLK
jgi:hypothetical protein